MGLDITLYGSKIETECYACGNKYEVDEELFTANITHNLTEMADKAGIYKALWRPEEIGCKKAKDVVPIIEKGLKDLKARPDYFKKYNSPNGWGMYKDFVPFVQEYLNACKENPDADIRISR